MTTLSPQQKTEIVRIASAATTKRDSGFLMKVFSVLILLVVVPGSSGI
jgi:hypothetical protein